MVKNLVLLFFLFVGFHATAQEKCSTEKYSAEEIMGDPAFKDNLNAIEAFIANRTSSSHETQRQVPLSEIIRIPVVVHVLYHTPDQNVSKAVIDNMINALNRDFNKRNSDTANIPAAFKPYAVAMGFEFKLATSDPKGVGTSGIVKKYTPVQYWLSDDKMKFNSSYGDDVWDSKSYLNIWLCNLKDVLGYSTLPGMDIKKEGVVISFDNIIDTKHTTPTVNDSRTLVHEVGHWLNLYHIWGDGYCGDDKVDDTPKQSTYTPGCPSGSRISSCGSSSSGDMYMNFMDFTDDICMNMFTNGQRKRARVLFDTGGPRHSMLYSKGLNTPVKEAAPTVDFYPKWYNAQLYPNPSTSSINLYFEYDERWIGQKLEVRDMAGKVVLNMIINSRIQNIDISVLKAGVYFINAKKGDEKLNGKFVKL